MHQSLKKQTNTKLLLVGAGGHAKVVIESLKSANQYSNIEICDDNPEKEGQYILGHKIIASTRSFEEPFYFHVCIGNNHARENLTNRYLSAGGKLISIADNNSILAPSASIGDGVYIAAGAIVSAEAKIERGTIINHNAIIEHDSRVAEYSHIAPGATVLGGAKVGKKVFAGAGSIVLPGVSVTDEVVLGAGAIAIRDINQKGSTQIGVPARNVQL
ncbi:acetyltransferase [Planctobacterium marinum]|uniref:acetyltransferase n=1 Tax=Planctobacterium marinum TaxID=1631968 RepID=UPI001E4A1D0A|nr:acetyltransferase [Planctobacterium marinum]MCC2606130.1 acetyltransferase [Planctobacterium marinum]